MLILCKQQGRRNWQLLCTRWEQSYLLCVQVHVNIVTSRQQFMRRWHLLVSLRVRRRQTLVSSPREICCYATSHLPLGVTNEKWENYHPHRIKLISGAVAGDSSLQDRGVAHYFYLCFLVLLVYLSIFTFVSLIKNTKNTCYLACCCHYGFHWKHQVVLLH